MGLLVLLLSCFSFMFSTLISVVFVNGYWHFLNIETILLILACAFILGIPPKQLSFIYQHDYIGRFGDDVN